MNEEEIKKQYANGIVNADEVIKSLIDKFKTDKTSVDIQQLQLIAEYLIYKTDKLQKENNKYIEEQNNVTIMETEYFKDKYISKDTIREILKINTIESISCDNNYKEPLLHLRKEIYDLIGVKNESSNRRTEK